MSTFQLGTCTVPNGKSGPWTIDTFEVLDDVNTMLMNLRYVRDGNPEMVCPSGTYKRLWHKDRGVVMSNTPMEVDSNRAAFEAATGRVLINGLGMGMMVEAILSKPDVTSLLVVELDKHVIKLVAKHFRGDERFKVVQADAYTFEPPAGVKFDYVWHDIWDTIDDDNLALMDKLEARYKQLCKKQSCWSRAMARKLQRRLAALG